nr:hypothetical protein [Tanacetum cinerariifolium]
KFVDPSFEEEILAFLSNLRYLGNIKTLSEVKVEILPQPWRTFGTIINKCLNVKSMKQSEAYKTYYAFATRKVIPRPKYVRRSVKDKTEQAPKASYGKRIMSAAKMKLAIKRSKTQLHSSQPSDLGAHTRTGVSPGVSDVPTYGSDDERISWKSSDEEDDDDDETNDNDEEIQSVNVDEDELDEEETNEKDEGDELYRDFSTHNEEDKEEDSFDPMVQTPSHVETTDDEDNDEEIQSVNVEEDELDKEETNEKDEGD